MRIPVHIVVGDTDTIAPPTTSGLAAAAAIPNAELDRLPRVGHYDFLSSCTEIGRAVVPQCETARAQAEAHRQAISAADAFFGRFLDAPR
jgi:pimeloyl-ACP methyl ester carboxylesterase